MNDEIEWFTNELDKNNEIKAVIWSDEEFSEYVKEEGLEQALYDITEFHAMIADQLRSRGVTSHEESDWASRTIGLCVRVKSRRQQLRAAVRAAFEDGWDRVARITAEVKEGWAD